MTQEDKDLLSKDLSQRLPYGVKVKVRSNDIRTVRAVDVAEWIAHFVESDSISPFGVHIEHPTTFRQVVKPFLRPMSSMTEEEKREYDRILKRTNERVFGSELSGKEKRYMFWDIEEVDFLNANYFDYRGLIPMGLALEAPVDMYKV